MSSLKDAAACCSHRTNKTGMVAQNNHDMSVTPDVSQSKYGRAASAAAASESHAATAVLILLSVMRMVGRGVGRGVGAQASSTCLTPHDVDSQSLWETRIRMTSASAPAEV